jgi:hypothetical protein
MIDKRLIKRRHQMECMTMEKLLRKPTPRSRQRIILDFDPNQVALWIRFEDKAYRTSKTGMQAGPIQVVDGKETCQLVPDLLLRNEISGLIDKMGLAQWVKDTYLPPEDYFHG